MSIPTFAAARMTERMVNREQELKDLEDAVCQSGYDTRVVIIEGQGGFGKTRLLNEALWRAGHPKAFTARVASIPNEKWSATQPCVISDLLDFTDTRLHTFNHFIEILRNSFAWHEAIEFPTYDAAIISYKRKLKDQAEYSVVKKAAEEAIHSFFEDYKQISKTYRLVWSLDTAEQLSHAGAAWFKEDLLTANDLNFSTQQELLERLKAGALPNTTIILVGRPEAQNYFEQLKAAADAPGSQFKQKSVTLQAFEAKEVKTYLEELAQDYQTLPDFDDDTAAYLKAMAEDEDRYKVLHLYTGGQPVRLALFVDILVEGKQEPEALQDTFEQAKQRVGWKDKEQPDEETLIKLRFEIEEEFINLLFVKTSNIRSRILTALVRARRGLDHERLYFILGNVSETDVKEWEKDLLLHKAIEQEMDPNNSDSLWRLSFIKPGVGGRLILQDELYRIYDEHMAAQDTSREDETKERQKLYRQLQAFAQQKIDRLRKIQAQNREEDESSLRWESPARALLMKFRYWGETEEEKRIALNESLLEAQLEKLHYEFRAAPDEAFNDAYNDFAEQMWRAGNQEADAQVQIELWRLLKDEYARRFVELKPRRSMVKNSTPWQTLERAAEQDDITRWIKRFFLRKEYKRAVEFAEAVEKRIETLPEDSQITLSHTFSRGERTCWQEFARIYLGQDVSGAIAKLSNVAKEMERLLTKEGISERGEFGFQGHPAEIRLRRVIGVAYNNLGYGYVTQGQYRLAVAAYAQALRYLRDTKFGAQEAVTLNNLARALSETGRRTRALRICQDGLELRQKLGPESPIAYSYNTLALIRNNNLVPDKAWPDAAKAVIYFRKLNDPRGLGLSLLQLGESIRRLAFAEQPMMDSPEELLDTAEKAIGEALDIFRESPEIMRRIEAEIEMGCLYRDYLHYVKKQSDPESSQETRWHRLQNLSLQHLKKAVSLSEANQYPQHQLDAQVNLAWTYYYAADFTKAEEMSKQILLDSAGKSFVLTKGEMPPDPEEVNETYALAQLNKLWALNGRIALDRFLDRTQTIKKESGNQAEAHKTAQTDPEANRRLQEAAEAFILSLGYAQLFSSRSPSINIAFDQLYKYLKKFNRPEMKSFYKHQHKARSDYKVTEIKAENLADVELFLLQSFGNYFPPPASKKKVSP